VFYLELAIDRTEFIRLHDFEPLDMPDPDQLLAEEQSGSPSGESEQLSADDSDELLKSLGM
jgi:hypothetical protein